MNRESGYSTNVFEIGNICSINTCPNGSLCIIFPSNLTICSCPTVTENNTNFNGLCDSYFDQLGNMYNHYLRKTLLNHKIRSSNSSYSNSNLNCSTFLTPLDDNNITNICDSWCSSSEYDYLQFEFKTNMYVSMIGIEGPPFSTNEFVDNLQINISVDTEEWKSFDVFLNDSFPKFIKFDKLIYSRLIRLKPRNFQYNNCLRTEIFGQFKNFDLCQSKILTCDGDKQIYKKGLNNFTFVECIGDYLFVDGKCNDINECLNETICGMNSYCNNNDGNYECICNDGFEKTNDICIDIDECTNNDQCKFNQICINYPGTFECSCSYGWILDDIGICVDDDPCSPQVGSLKCNENATCLTTNNKSMCICNDGFIGNGIICEEINECLLVTSECQEYSFCIDLLNSYTCKCLEGFEGDKYKCRDINECNYEDICPIYHTCHNTIGSYYCKCPENLIRQYTSDKYSDDYIVDNNYNIDYYSLNNLINNLLLNITIETLSNSLNTKVTLTNKNIYRIEIITASLMEFKYLYFPDVCSYSVWMDYVFKDSIHVINNNFIHFYEEDKNVLISGFKMMRIDKSLNFSTNSIKKQGNNIEELCNYSINDSSVLSEYEIRIKDCKNGTININFSISSKTIIHFRQFQLTKSVNCSKSVIRLENYSFCGFRDPFKVISWNSSINIEYKLNYYEENFMMNLKFVPKGQSVAMFSFNSDLYNEIRYYNNKKYYKNSRVLGIIDDKLLLNNMKKIYVFEIFHPQMSDHLCLIEQIHENLTYSFECLTSKVNISHVTCECYKDGFVAVYSRYNIIMDRFYLFIVYFMSFFINFLGIFFYLFKDEFIFFFIHIIRKSNLKSERIYILQWSIYNSTRYLLIILDGLNTVKNSEIIAYLVIINDALLNLTINYILVHIGSFYFKPILKLYAKTRILTMFISLIINLSIEILDEYYFKSILIFHRIPVIKTSIKFFQFIYLIVILIKNFKNNGHIKSRVKTTKIILLIILLSINHVNVELIKSSYSIKYSNILPLIENILFIFLFSILQQEPMIFYIFKKSPTDIHYLLFIDKEE